MPLFSHDAAVFTFILVATLAVLYLLVCAWLAHRFTRPSPRLPSAAPQHPEPSALRVRLPSRDGRADIDGWYLPAEPRQGAVVLVQGRSVGRGAAARAAPLDLAARLRGMGLSVLLIDLRGHGASSRARLSYGWHERHDVLGAADFLLARGYAPGRIGVLGVSLGASTAVLAAAQEPAIGALVVDSAFASVETMLARQFERLSRMPRWFLPGTLAIGRVLLGVDVRRVQPLACMPRLRDRPVLVIHSQGDRVVPVSDAQALALACGGECWHTDSDGHGSSYRALPLAYEIRVATFFARHLDVLPPLRATPLEPQRPPLRPTSRLPRHPPVTAWDSLTLG